MDFTIDRADLLAAIDKCALAVPDPKHPTEVFRVMTVDASKKKTVRFAAVGEYCSVDTVSKAEIKSQGTFNVYPRHLRDIASVMPPGRIQCSLKGTRVTVKSLVSSRKASFEHHTVDIKPIEDPGKGAPWVEVDSQELMRGLQATKAASTWFGMSDPVASLLMPTERGLDVFGCNMYLITVAQTSIRIDGPPIVMPATAIALLALMAPMDANVSLLTVGNRVYLENCDTLVSASLFEYKFLQTHLMMMSLLTEGLTVGPTFELARLTQGVKALGVLSGFAGAADKKNEFGLKLRISFGQTVRVSLALAAADGVDEFDVGATNGEFEVFLSSGVFEKMLSSLDGHKDVQAVLTFNDPTQLLVLRSQGIQCGIMVAKGEP